MQNTDIILGDLDYSRLITMPLSDELRAELDRAIVVPMNSISHEIVTLFAHVRYRDEATQQCRGVEIVPPEDADAARGRVSVLAPVGAALIGLCVGQSIAWPFPDGSLRHLTVLEVSPATAP
ncbi:MAG: nucleoside diphosphate kinase regulator [Candidatus Dactylopiibacterium sp.]|nr:nucleoside diphosphate kinase regulator [Candidatus Dactylopiibacterium sp.]